MPNVPADPAGRAKGRAQAGPHLTLARAHITLSNAQGHGPAQGAGIPPCSSALRAGVLSCHLGEGSPSTGRGTVHLGLPQSKAVALIAGTFTSRGHWQSLETFLVVTQGGWYCWHLVGEARDAARHLPMHRSAPCPHHRITQPRCQQCQG